MAAAEPEPRLASLVKQLGAETPRERELAGEELLAAGTSARGLLQKAARHSDPEIRLRAETLLGQLRVRALWSPSLVSYQSTRDSATPILASLTLQSGNHLTRNLGAAAKGEEPLAVDFARVSYWQAVDQVCARSGLLLRAPYAPREPGQVVELGTARIPPTAYAGPFRMQLHKAVRNFNERHDLREGRTQLTHTFELELQTIWEDRFQLTAYRNSPMLIEAVTDTGDKLALAQAANQSWSVTGTRAKEIFARLALTPPPAKAAKLDRLRLKWEFAAADELRSVTFENLQSGGNLRRDGLELTVQSLQPRGEGRHELVLLVSRDTALPEPPEILQHEYRAEVFDARGRPFTMRQESQLLTDQGVQLRINISPAVGSGQTADSRPESLSLHYSDFHSNQMLEIEFRDVPLPQARPE